MPLPALIVISILYAGVIWLSMKLVELSGGVASQAFTVARSINNGVLSWAARGGRPVATSSPRAIAEASAAALDRDPEPRDAANEMTVSTAPVRRVGR
ncbi:MAG: hypothetical protein AB1736_12380 [Chloroflexota bacterium]